MIYGIDLGTTFCAIAQMNQLDEPVCLPLGESGLVTLPSAVLLRPNNKVYVGTEAIEESYQPNTLLIEFAKRGIGMQNTKWDYQGRSFTPECVAALILRKIAQEMGQDRNLAPVQDVVVSHPQYFGLHQKEATGEAVRLAGLNLISTITEPNAAAIAYGVATPSEDGEKVVLVFDLGGGTFDVTLMKIGGRTRFQMLKSDGDARLGGIDWDSAIVKRAKESFSNLAGEDFDDVASAEDKINLRVAAEKAKIALSHPDKDFHRFLVQAEGQKVRVEITKTDFIEMTRPLVKRCLDRCRQLLDEGHYRWNEVNEILLVGSSTKMPEIVAQVEQISGIKPRLDRDPKLMVAKGAAIWGHWVSRKRIDARWGQAEATPEAAGLSLAADTPQISGCTAHGLGVLATMDGQKIVKRLVLQNAATPCTAEQLFQADRDGATALLVSLYEGESEDPEECSAIGQVRLEDLPPLQKGQPVKVQFKIDVAGRLAVTVADVNTGHEKAQVIDRSFLRETRPGAASSSPCGPHLRELIIQ